MYGNLHERAEFNIGGAHIPLGQVQMMQVDQLENLKNQEVIVYCRSGNRSGQAAMIIRHPGIYQYQEPVGRYVGLAAEVWEPIGNRQ